jgi:hypothetical protein
MKMKPITPPAKIGPYQLNYDTVDTSSIQDQIFFTIIKQSDQLFRNEKLNNQFSNSINSVVDTLIKNLLEFDS